MNAPLYTTEILRLAASLPEPIQLEQVDAKGEARSPTCGSTVHVEVQLGEDGKVKALSQRVHACAFGQASAALLASGAKGQGPDAIAGALAELSAWLTGERDEPGTWPGVAALAPARSRRSRHGAILLPFKALVSALRG